MERHDDPVVELNIRAACSSAHLGSMVDQDLVGAGIHEFSVGEDGPLEGVDDLEVEAQAASRP